MEVANNDWSTVKKLAETFSINEKYPSFYDTIIHSKEWEEWEGEQEGRHKENCTGCFDYDESRECGWLSPEHWSEFVKWIRLSPREAKRGRK